MYLHVFELLFEYLFERLFEFLFENLFEHLFENYTVMYVCTFSHSALMSSSPEKTLEGQVTTSLRTK
jgi:hypothetical protein